MGEKTPDREMVYPAKDWEEAITRILDSGWFISMEAKQIGGITQWTTRIHDGDDYVKSLQRIIARAGELTESIMKTYNKWRDAQLKGDEE